ncbi:HAUS augmin-like complex subunit 4, partial [Nibea albiflora]
VHASFPLCDIAEEDLTQNPQFCKLLATLTQHVDQTGLTVPLKTELDKAEQKLQSQRRQWLRSESLYKGLQEMIQDHCIRKHHATIPPDQNMFFETMEKSLLVSQCIRQLDLSSTTNQGPALYSGSDPPSHDGAHAIREESESEGLKSSKLSHLSAQLDKEKKRAESLKETCRENSVLLQRQTQLYLSELIKCIQLLQSLILDHRLRIQTDLDRKKERLDSELKACQAEKQSVELKLASFEILGKDFEALAEEYCRLRQEIEMKNWALKEFTQYNDK